MDDERIADDLNRLNELRVQAIAVIDQAEDGEALETARVRFTGKKSEINKALAGMARLQPEDRRSLGAAVNTAKGEIERVLAAKSAEIHRLELDRRLESELVDVTLPGVPVRRGYTNPLLAGVRELLEILTKLGFAVYEGPDVEWDSYNFTMLNIPRDHPSRDLQDTFYVSDDVVLRTQTSPAQIRIMQQRRPPLRVAVPGFVYRNEAEDASHGDRFYQIEGLAVDTDITLADLKGTLTQVAQRFFGSDRPVRFRPHYFPFTEPSAEYDIQCAVCQGAGCRSCGNEGWLELGGAGMVHPRVLENVGYDPEKLSGFAFGIGPDRYTMSKYGITDLRLFRENDLRFLRQFS
ncbi:MAG TPA: phenylalanine--tRNA ligase subunit alpha [Chloroflexota bacterium]